MRYYILFGINRQGEKFIVSKSLKKRLGMSFGEIKQLVTGQTYKNFVGCPDVPPFKVEPCVGGMASGIQMKWRIRYGDNKESAEERVPVVMTGLPFLVGDHMFIITYSAVENTEKNLKAGYWIRHVLGNC